jgi:hypothetical protein
MAPARSDTVETPLRRKPREASERKPFRLRPGGDRGESDAAQAKSRTPKRKPALASARSGTGRHRSGASQTKDSKAEIVMVSARARTVKTPVRRKPSQGLRNGNCRGFGRDRDRGDPGRRKPERPPDGTQARLRPRQGTARNLPRVFSEEVCLQRASLMVRFRSRPTFRALARSGGFGRD